MNDRAAGKSDYLGDDGISSEKQNVDLSRAIFDLTGSAVLLDAV